MLLLFGLRLTGFLNCIPLALMDRFDMLGKIKAQVAVVALHQFRGLFWPKSLWAQVVRRVCHLEVFDESFGIRAELSTSGNHRAQVQPVSKGRKPFSAFLMPIWPSQLVKAYAKAIGSLDDLLSASAEGGNHRPSVSGLRGPVLSHFLVNLARRRLIASWILLVAADFAPEQQVVAQEVPHPPRTGQRPAGPL